MKINYLKDGLFDLLNDNSDKVIVDCQPGRIVIEKEKPLQE